MEFTDKTGEPRTNEEIVEAILVIRKEMVSGEPQSVMVFYPTITDGLMELLHRRKET